MAARETSKFLGVISGIFYDYQVFDRYVLESDLQRIERYYRAEGFYRARVRAGRVYYEGNQQARVEILVEEGPRAIVNRIVLHGVKELPETISRSLFAALEGKLEIGDPLRESDFARAADELRIALTDQGYAYAEIERRAEVSLPKNVARVDYWICPGKPTRIGAIRIEGLGAIPEAPVRRALDINPGEPYSSSDIEEAEQAVLNLGVFSSVNVEAELPQGPAESLPDAVPLRVQVQPSKLRGVHFGGGVHVDTIQTDVHLTAGWEHRNLFGGFQHFLVEIVPGVVLHPTRLPVFESPERLLPQGRLRSEYRSPGFLEPRTNLVVRTQASVFPVLLSNETSEDVILGYQDYRAALGVERSLWRFYGSASQNIQVNKPFTYRGVLDPDLSTALISYPEVRVTLDLRDESRRANSESAREDEIKQDRLSTYLSSTVQLAGLGGDARDLKIQPEARLYLALTRDLTLGLRGAIGLLFPWNYGETIEINALTGQPGDVSRAIWVRDVQLTSLRGLFAGGSSSNRGYAAREIGPHGVVPFFIPSLTSVEIVEQCDATSPTFDSANCDVPLGGFTLWETSLELRYPLIGSFAGTVFADTADVSAGELDFRFDRPHLSVGLGLRYETPIGPIRFDAGYRVPGLQSPESPDEGVPDELFGLPIAISFGIGEVF